MTSASDYLKNLKNLRSGLLDEVERIIYANENEIIKLNIQKIDEHIGSDGKKLINDNDRFSGKYSISTELISRVKNPLAPKIAGQPYNWVWQGNFVNNFQVEVLPSLTQIEIFSTGTGSGLKADFFKGYKNMFGLTVQDQKKLNYDIIYPDLMQFVNKYI